MPSRTRCGPDVDQGQRERRRLDGRDALTCWVGGWACQDSNLGPHPYQQSRAYRCATLRFRRWCATVEGQVMRSKQRRSSCSILAAAKLLGAQGYLFSGQVRSGLAVGKPLMQGWTPRGRPPSPWLGRRPEQTPGAAGVLSSWQGGTAEGRGANPRPCHGHGSLPNQLAPGRLQDEGNRSP
jgi:hypothetical protein